MGNAIKNYERNARRKNKRIKKSVKLHVMLLFKEWAFQIPS